MAGEGGIVGYVKFAGIVAAALAIAAAAWTVNTWRLTAKSEKAKNVVLAGQLAEKDRQLAGYELVVKQLRAVSAIKDKVIVESRARGEELARRLEAISGDLAKLEREREAWQAQPYTGTCEEMVRDFAKRGGARP
jgi:chromosome segregation ATPase